jgi:hypothetical protein
MRFEAYLISTVPPAASILALISSASALLTAYMNPMVAL